MKITLDDTTLGLTKNSKGYRVTLDDKTAEVEILRADDGKLELLIDGQRVVAYVSMDNAKRWVTINGRTVVLTKPAAGATRKSSRHESGSGLTAPMPGLVRSVNVVEGEAVEKGQTLMTVEAMKMEIRIQAPRVGTIKKISVRQGQIVDRGQTLIEME